MKERLPLSDAGNEISRSKPKRLPSFAGRAGLLGAAVAVPGIQAGTVQISQDGNELTVTGGTFANNLDADYTGDDVDDARDLVGVVNNIGMQDAIRLDISYTYMRVGWSSGAGGFFIAKPPTQYNQPSVPFTKNFLIPVEFTDSRINGGVTSNGFMHVKAFHTTFNTYACELVRLIFDDANTAAPGGVSAGTTYDEWQESVAPPPSTNPPMQAIDVIIIAQKIKKTKKKLKKLKKSGKKAKAKKLKKKLKKLKKLQAQL